MEPAQDEFQNASRPDKENEDGGLDTELTEEMITSNWDEAISSFDDMDLREDLLRGIYAYGFEKPSAIQQRGIVPIVRGHDTIAQAQSGTGKTATFSISMLQRIDMDEKQTQVHQYKQSRRLGE